MIAIVETSNTTYCLLLLQSAISENADKLQMGDISMMPYDLTH